MYKRINVHKFDVQTQNKSRVALEHSSLPGHSATDLKVTNLEKDETLTEPLYKKMLNLHISKKIQANSEVPSKHNEFLTVFN